MDILIKGLNVNNRVFNIGVFAFVNIFLYQHPDKYFPEIDKNLFWQKIEKVSQFNKESIINTIGYKPESEYSILFTVFFMFPEESKSEFPGLYDKFLTAFNIH
jgi:hypothetical protein